MAHDDSADAEDPDAKTACGPTEGSEAAAEQVNPEGPTKVAIACQGGGSHTAFTAGVLTELLEGWDQSRYELVGISGTSGGAFNALAVWYGLVTGDDELARRLLLDLWDDVAAKDPADRLANEWLEGIARLESAGAPIPSISPYQVPGTRWGRGQLRRILERHVDFEAIPDLCTRNAPELVVGTVDVNGGEFETFTNESVTVEAMLASAAIPNLFQAVEIDGHYHWDGLLSQNPPIKDLLRTPPDRKPEELWVVQINPQTYGGEPRRLRDIVDRRNELAGNISLNQELRFVETVNRWLEQGHLPEDRYTHTEIRRIMLDGNLSYTSKLDRDPDFIEELVARGVDAADQFLADLTLGEHEHDIQTGTSHNRDARPEAGYD